MVALLCVYGLLVGCLATVQVAGLQEQHTVATRPPPPPPVASPALYFLLMNQQMNKVYNFTAVRAVFTRAAAAGYAVLPPSPNHLLTVVSCGGHLVLVFDL